MATALWGTSRKGSRDEETTTEDPQRENRGGDRNPLQRAGQSYDDTWLPCRQPACSYLGAAQPPSRLHAPGCLSTTPRVKDSGAATPSAGMFIPGGRCGKVDDASCSGQCSLPILGPAPCVRVLASLFEVQTSTTFVGPPSHRFHLRPAAPLARCSTSMRYKIPILRSTTEL